MKIRFIFPVLFFFSQNIFSVSHYGLNNPLKIIIACATSDAAKINEIKLILKADTAMHYVMHCSNHAVFLVEYNGPQQEVEAKIVSLRKIVSMNDKSFYIKEYSFGNIMDNCNSDLDPDLKKR